MADVLTIGMPPVGENNNVRGQTAWCAKVVVRSIDPVLETRTKAEGVETFVTNGARENAGQGEALGSLPEGRKCPP